MHPPSQLRLQEPHEVFLMNQEKDREGPRSIDHQLQWCAAFLYCDIQPPSCHIQTRAWLVGREHGRFLCAIAAKII